MICSREMPVIQSRCARQRTVRLARILVSQQTHQYEDVFFQVGDKDYTLRFVLKPTWKIFPYSPYGGGDIVEITWFPSLASGEGKWERTNDTALGDVRDILRKLPGLVMQWIGQKQPVGFYWKGNDPRLESIWARVTRGINVTGYVPSKVKPNVYVKEKLKQYLDTQSLD